MIPSPDTLHFIVPGSLLQRTGGYLYDARMVEGLRRRGWRVRVHELAGRFPEPDALARESLGRALSGIEGGSRVVVDGLALGGSPEAARAHAERLRLVALVHHPLSDETGLSDDARARLFASERDALAVCSGVIVTSPYTARRLTGYGVPASKVRTVVPGTSSAPRASGPGAEAPPSLLCVGIVTPRKGQDVLIRALAELVELPWTCTLAGDLERDPPFAASVRGLVERLGLGSRVDLAGELAAPALARRYDQASVFVLPSHYEGYGMALSEALARGLPVVSTTGGAIPETVPEEAGILVPPGDPAALARALEVVLRDPERRSAAAAAALRHGTRLPDWETQTGSFHTALLDLTTDG